MWPVPHRTIADRPRPASEPRNVHSVEAIASSRAIWASIIGRSRSAVAAAANERACRAAAGAYRTYRRFWGLSAGDGPEPELLFDQGELLLFRRQDLGRRKAQSARGKLAEVEVISVTRAIQSHHEPVASRDLAEETGLPVHVADDPLSAVAEGSGRVLQELQFLNRVAFSAKT